MKTFKQFILEEGKTKPVPKSKKTTTKKSATPRKAPKATSVSSTTSPAATSKSITPYIQTEIKNIILNSRKLDNNSYDQTNAIQFYKDINNSYTSNRSSSSFSGKLIDIDENKKALDSFNKEVKKIFPSLKSNDPKKKFQAIEKFKSAFNVFLDWSELDTDPDVGYYEIQEQPETETPEQAQEVLDPSKLFQKTVIDLKRYLSGNAKDLKTKMKILFSSMLDKSVIGKI